MGLHVTSQNNKVNFVLHPHNYTHLYNHLIRDLEEAPEYQNLFAKPSKKSTTTNWVSQVEGKFKSYDSLKDEEKNWVADYLEMAVVEVGKILQRKKTFKDFHDELFTIPSTKAIMVAYTNEGPVVVLTEWACKNNKTTAEANPIRTTINKPRPNRSRVIIEVQYTDGSVAGGQLFSVDYGTHQKSYKTNGEGLRDLGKFRLGAQFVVYSDQGGKRKYPQNFTVSEEGKYLVVFPLLVEGRVKVVNQKNKTVPNSTVVIDYEGEQKEINTGKIGIEVLGGLEVGKKIVVTPKEAPENAKTFTIAKSKNNFVVEVEQTFFADATISVVDQKGKSLADIPLVIEYKEKEEGDNSGDSGVVELFELEVGEEIRVWEKGTTGNVRKYTVEEGENKFVFEIVQPIFSNATINVVDENNEPLEEFPVMIGLGGEEKEFSSSNTGIIRLADLEVGKQITVRGKNTGDEPQSFTIEEDEDENVYLLKIIPKLVTVKLVNKRDEPIPGVSIDFTFGGKDTSDTTNEKGICTFPYNAFTDREKVKAVVRLPKKGKKDKDGKTKEKRIKKKFTFKDEQSEYIIKLKPNRWWLLLLLLLPLLLLVRCDKDIQVRTINAESLKPVEGAKVQFYYEHFLYDDWNFLTGNPEILYDTTNQAGIADFKGLKYTVYSWIFQRGSKAQVFATNECYASDTLNPYFHSMSSALELKLTPIYAPVDFRVVDKSDSEPLPEASVVIEAEFDGKPYTDSAKTDPNGRVVFNQIPKCATITKIRGSERGYFPDSIVNKLIPDLMGNVDSSRTLRLQPITEKLVFFVKDCRTNEPLGGVPVVIEIDNGKKKSKENKLTNVNGVGKGEYDKAHIIAEVTLTASHPPKYKSGGLPPYLVKDFIKLPDSLRTICLEPIPDLVSFVNVDSFCQRPIAGVKNVVVIVGGGKTKRLEEISNGNGRFSVPVYAGDKISIVAQYPPDYEDNKTKIKDVDGVTLVNAPPSERTIPLKPKMISMYFRTVDADNPIQAVPNADVVVRFSNGCGDIQVPPNKSNGNGEFLVSVPATSLISIDASKTGYGSNSSKINGTPAKSLQFSSQIDRDIPLKKEPEPCNSDFKEGNEGTTVNEHNMVYKDMKFSITYDMQSKPDQIFIYCGRKNNLGRELYRSPGFVSNGTTVPVDLSTCGGTSWITVKIVGGQQGTAWSYNIDCN